MIYFRATEDQVKQMMALATNASAPAGLGHLHATNKVFKPEDFEIVGGFCILDYVQGRMVKFSAHRVNGDIWAASEHVRPDYQSWAWKYPSYGQLARAAGGELVEAPVGEEAGNV